MRLLGGSCGAARVVTVEMVWKAAKKQDAALVKQLVLDSHAQSQSLSIVNEYHPKKGTTPLMVACRHRDKVRHGECASDVVQVLLEFGADMALKAKNKEGNTALHYAAASNQTRSVEYMVHAGVDVFALNAEGHAPIDLARWHRSREVLMVLTQHARVKSGWLFIKKSSKRGLHRWKKRFCVALACNREQTLLELSIYKDPHELRPTGVVLLRVGTHAMVTSPKKSWLDKPNMFRMDRPMVVQDMRARRRFSRSQESQEMIENAGETEEFQFATESAEMRDAWMALLHRGGHVEHLVVPVEARFPQPPPPSSSSTLSTQSEALELFNSTTSSPMATPTATATPARPPPPPMQPLPASWEQPQPQRSAIQRVTSDELPIVLSPLVATHTPSYIPSAPSFDDQSFYAPHTTTTMGDVVVPSSSSSSSSTAATLRTECVICMDATRDAICVPCGHVAGCLACLTHHVQAHRACPICRASVMTVVKIFEC